ncbi:uncharacterized protein LOC143774138 [Ranitomeya variabilis]|uniref:uncharacterized protein LOC143774138 n=1 Tax=Ranitomeya variabilis TaxID=490064 RepID=UPI004056CDAF
MGTPLEPLVTTLPSYVRDSSHFISTHKGVLLSPGDLMVTCDVESLYSNINHDDGTQAVLFFLDQQSTFWIWRLAVRMAHYPRAFTVSLRRQMDFWIIRVFTPGTRGMEFRLANSLELGVTALRMWTSAERPRILRPGSRPGITPRNASLVHSRGQMGNRRILYLLSIKGNLMAMHGLSRGTIPTGLRPDFAGTTAQDTK